MWHILLAIQMWSTSTEPLRDDSALHPASIVREAASSDVFHPSVLLYVEKLGKIAVYVFVSMEDKDIHHYF